MKKVFGMSSKIAGMFRKTVSAWKAETPKFWKWVAGASASGAVIIPLLANINIPGVTAPAYFTNNAWTAMAVCLVIGFIAKTRVKK